MHEEKTKWKDSARKTSEYIGYMDGKADNPYSMYTVFRLLEHMNDKDGQPLLFPEYEIELYATNLPEDPGTIIDLYHDHANCEQAHSELKGDMCFEKLSSGKFPVNSTLLSVAMISFNILRMIGQTALSSGLYDTGEDISRRRLRKVIDDLIRFAGKLVKDGRRMLLYISGNAAYSSLFMKLWGCFSIYLPRYIV